MCFCCFFPTVNPAGYWLTQVIFSARFSQTVTELWHLGKHFVCTSQLVYSGFSSGHFRVACGEGETIRIFKQMFWMVTKIKSSTIWPPVDLNGFLPFLGNRKQWDMQTRKAWKKERNWELCPYFTKWTMIRFEPKGTHFIVLNKEIHLSLSEP